MDMVKNCGELSGWVSFTACCQVRTRKLKKQQQESKEDFIEILRDVHVGMAQRGAQHLQQQQI